MTRFVGYSLLVAACIVLSGQAVIAQDDAFMTRKQAEERIDFNRARQLLQKFRRGEKLTPEEKSYLDRARELRRKQSGRATRNRRPPVGGRLPVGLTPLTDLPANKEYKGQADGPYGDGKNDPPPGHLEAALQQSKKIQPLDAAGKPDPDGKIVLISSGMSNVTQEFQQFLRLAGAVWRWTLEKGLWTTQLNGPEIFECSTATM